MEGAGSNMKKLVGGERMVAGDEWTKGSYHWPEMNKRRWATRNNGSCAATKGSVLMKIWKNQKQQGFRTLERRRMTWMMPREILRQHVCLIVISVRTCFIRMLCTLHLRIKLEKPKKEKKMKRKTDSNKTFLKTKYFLARHAIHSEQTAGNSVCVSEDNPCSFLLLSRSRCGEVRKAGLQKSLSRPPWVLSPSRSVLSFSLSLCSMILSVIC